MKRFKSLLCASLLTLSLSSATLAGNISGGAPSSSDDKAGNISGGTPSISYANAGNISGGAPSISDLADEIYFAILGLLVS